MTFVTDFADQAVMLPLALAVALALLALGWRRAALAWAACVIATFGTMLVLKLAFAACGSLDTSRLGTIGSPSGHTAAGAMVYGGLAGLLLRRGIPGALLPAAAVAVLIGATRVWLDVHTLAEVILGGLVGCAGATAFIALAGPRPQRWRPAWLLIPILLVPLLAHGRNLGAEPHIRGLGERYAWLIPACGAPAGVRAGAGPAEQPLTPGRRYPRSARYRPRPGSRRTAPRSAPAESSPGSPAGARSPAAGRCSRFPSPASSRHRA